MATYRGGSSMNDNNRNALFGNRRPGGQSYAEETRALYEAENNRAQEVLGEQVGHLKELALQINGEVNAQNSLLDNMGGTFGETGQLMAGTLKKLQHMIETGGSKHMCYLIMFIVGLFIFFWFLLGRRV